MSDKTGPGRDPRALSALAVETYFDQAGLAAGGPLAPQRPAIAVDLRRPTPTNLPAALGARAACPVGYVAGHIIEDGGTATITMRPADPWGFGSVA